MITALPDAHDNRGARLSTKGRTIAWVASRIEMQTTLVGMATDHGTTPWELVSNFRRRHSCGDNRRLMLHPVPDPLQRLPA